MDPEDLQFVPIAFRLIEYTKSRTLLEALERFFECISFASTTKHLIPEPDRRKYELNVLSTKTQLLREMVGE
jgi:hypothetical protein